MTPAAEKLRTAGQELRRAEYDQNVLFRVSTLWGFSEKGVSLPVAVGHNIVSGPIQFMLDPDAASDANCGMVQFGAGKLWVRYAAQLMCPRAFEMVENGELDPAFLIPWHMVNTEECELNPDLSGWRACGVATLTMGSSGVTVGVG